MTSRLLQCKRYGCRGILAKTEDEYGSYISCLLCGAEHSIDGQLLETRDPIAEGINVHVFEKHNELAPGMMVNGRSKGDRPRKPTLNELSQQSSLEIQNNNKGERLPNDLKELKEMYRLKVKNMGVG